MNFLIFMMLSVLAVLASFLWEFTSSFERRSTAALFLFSFGSTLVFGLYLIIQTCASMYSFSGGWDWLRDGWFAGCCAAVLVDLGIWWLSRAALRWMRKIAAQETLKNDE